MVIVRQTGQTCESQTHCVCKHRRSSGSPHTPKLCRPPTHRHLSNCVSVITAAGDCKALRAPRANVGRHTKALCTPKTDPNIIMVLPAFQLLARRPASMAMFVLQKQEEEASQKGPLAGICLDTLLPTLRGRCLEREQGSPASSVPGSEGLSERFASSEA